MKFDLSEFLEDARNLHINSVSVVQDGEETARYAAGKTTMGNLYSGTKSFTSAAAGLAAAEKLFDLDDRVADHFPDELPESVSGYLENMRLRHLLNMSMGIAEPLLMGEDRPELRVSEPDWVRFCLRQTISREPGSTFLYSNAGPYLLGVLIQRKSGRDLLSYLKPRLLDPLEIDITGREVCPKGYVFGASGFRTDIDGLSRFGQLYLQKGVWKGKRILPEEWVAESGREQIPAPGDDETGRGYGYGFWTLPGNAWRLEGKYGQYCLICPEQNAVVAIKANNTDHPDRPVLRTALRTIVSHL